MMMSLYGGDDDHSEFIWRGWWSLRRRYQLCPGLLWDKTLKINKYIVKKNYNIAIVGFCLLDKACYRCLCNANVMPCWEELFSVYSAGLVPIIPSVRQCFGTTVAAVRVVRRDISWLLIIYRSLLQALVFTSGKAWVGQHLHFQNRTTRRTSTGHINWPLLTLPHSTSGGSTLSLAWSVSLVQT